MATKRTTFSWGDVKDKLADRDCAGLLGLLQHLYAASKDNRAFLHTRLCGRSVGAVRRPWAFLASIRPMAPHDIEATILRATGGTHPLDVTFVDDADLAAPGWRQASTSPRLAGTKPLA